MRLWQRRLKIKRRNNEREADLDAPRASMKRAVEIEPETAWRRRGLERLEAGG